ncbi:phosphotransferase family protein [Streptomyces polyrhachis]|uniref:Phosphotransferase family protein n=1 Tax=Streptomyces polyrhachis TaxID=1282885 RepID=A0ABW2GP61_9ACTN
MPIDPPSPPTWAANLSNRIRLEAHHRLPWINGRRVLQGHHNRNVVVPLGRLARVVPSLEGTTHVKFRTPLRTLEVVPRLWTDEYTLLQAIRPYVENVPLPLARHGHWTVHSYVNGDPLGYLFPRREQPLDDKLLRLIAELMRTVASVPKAALPPVRPDWPTRDDSRGFLHRLITFSEEQVRKRYLPEFGVLFARLGIPDDAITRFRDRARKLSARSLCLVHADLHRDNIIKQGPDLHILDWELALYGDPLHELATHLVRMGYDENERKRMRGYWADEALPAHSNALDDDLPVYLDFECVQSVLTDTMRAARSLRPQPSASALEGAAGAIRRALAKAERPLDLPWIPDEGKTIDALCEWQSQPGNRPGRRLLSRH